MRKSKENIMADKKQKRNDTVDPYSIQIGGTHYKKMKIQPSRFVIENKLAFPEGNAENLRLRRYFIKIPLTFP